MTLLENKKSNIFCITTDNEDIIFDDNGLINHCYFTTNKEYSLYTNRNQLLSYTNNNYNSHIKDRTVYNKEFILKLLNSNIDINCKKNSKALEYNVNWFFKIYSTEEFQITVNMIKKENEILEMKRWEENNPGRRDLALNSRQNTLFLNSLSNQDITNHKLQMFKNINLLKKENSKSVFNYKDSLKNSNNCDSNLDYNDFNLKLNNVILEKRLNKKAISNLITNNNITDYTKKTSKSTNFNENVEKSFKKEFLRLEKEMLIKNVVDKFDYFNTIKNSSRDTKLPLNHFDLKEHRCNKLKDNQYNNAKIENKTYLKFINKIKSDIIEPFSLEKNERQNKIIKTNYICNKYSNNNNNDKTKYNQIINTIESNFFKKDKFNTINVEYDNFKYKALKENKIEFNIKNLVNTIKNNCYSNALEELSDIEETPINIEKVLPKKKLIKSLDYNSTNYNKKLNYKNYILNENNEDTIYNKKENLNNIKNKRDFLINVIYRTPLLSKYEKENIHNIQNTKLCDEYSNNINNNTAHIYSNKSFTLHNNKNLNNDINNNLKNYPNKENYNNYRIKVKNKLLNNFKTRSNFKLN